MSTSKPKFQIGDKVKIIDASGGSIPLGAIRTVKTTCKLFNDKEPWFYVFEEGPGLYEHRLELVQEEPKFKEGRLYAPSWDNKQKYTCTYVSPLSGVAMMERENPVGSLAVYKDQQHYWTEVPEKAKGTVYIHWAWSASTPNKIVCEISPSLDPQPYNQARHIRTDKIECEADIKG